MWYKQANHPYFDIGHKPSKGSPTFLWWWNNGLQVQQTEDPNYGHSQAVDHAIASAPGFCKGRYDPVTNMISIMAIQGIPEGCADALKAKWPGAHIRVFRR